MKKEIIAAALAAATAGQINLAQAEANGKILGAQIFVEGFDGIVTPQQAALRAYLRNVLGDAAPADVYFDGGVHKRVWDYEDHNLVVTVGKQLILDRIFGLSGTAAVSRLGVGTSATAAALTDTALTGSVFQVFDATPTRSGTAVTCVCTFGTGAANINWQEMGMDNATTLLDRIAPIGPFNKTAAVSIVVTLVFTQN